MPKIIKQTGSFPAFAENANTGDRTVFDGDSRSDDLNDNLTNAFRVGWGAATDLNRKPSLEDFNGLGFTLSRAIGYLMQTGVPEYDAAQEYFVASVVTYDGIVYIALKDNTNQLPNVDREIWKIVGGITKEQLDTALRLKADLKGNTTIPFSVANPINSHSALNLQTGDSRYGNYVTVYAYANSVNTNGVAQSVIYSTRNGTGSNSYYNTPSLVGKAFEGTTQVRKGDGVPTISSDYTWKQIPGAVRNKLFSTADRQTRGTVTLSESMTNYTELELIFEDNSFRKSPMRILVSNFTGAWTTTSGNVNLQGGDEGDEGVFFNRSSNTTITIERSHQQGILQVWGIR